LFDKGKPSPFDDLPELDLVESLYHNDFIILGTERNNGMGIGSIPVTRIMLYAKQEGVLDVDLFRRIILRLDNHYLTLVSKRQTEQSNKPSKD